MTKIREGNWESFKRVDICVKLYLNCFTATVKSTTRRRREACRLMPRHRSVSIQRLFMIGDGSLRSFI